mgnify:CR=1 FL=1
MERVKQKGKKEKELKYIEINILTLLESLKKMIVFNSSYNFLLQYHITELELSCLRLKGHFYNLHYPNV